MPPSNDALAAMNSVVSNTIALITQLETVIGQFQHKSDSSVKDANTRNSAESTEVQQQQQQSLDAFSLAHDSANLIKAHSTKISLFIINEPFTPTAISKVLRELITGPIPGLASAVQLCDGATYTKVLQRDLAWHSARVYRELRELLSRIPKDGKILSGDKKNASAGAAAGKGSLAATGVLWAVCDDLMALAKRGFAGNLVQKVEQFRDTLKDVMEELKEWGEQTADDEDEDGDEDDEDEGGDEVNQLSKGMASTQISDAQSMLDDLMSSEQYIPRDDPDRIRERLESCLKRLRLVTLLYQATVKRRLKPLPQVPPPVTASNSKADNPPAGGPSNTAARLDEIIPLLAKIPERFGSLALAFYELDPAEIDSLMDQCFFDAFAVSELLMKPWEGQKDEFTDWALRFQGEIRKG